MTEVSLNNNLAPITCFYIYNDTLQLTLILNSIDNKWHLDYANVQLSENLANHYYDTLEVALNLASDGDEIILLKDIESNTIKVEKNYRIDAIFYKYLSSFEDWQKISKTDPENYILTNNINFEGRSKVNTKIVVNRLETAGDDINYSLSGFNITVTSVALSSVA